MAVWGTGVSYSERVDWVEELIEWFESLDPHTYGVEIPNCPGWTVANMVAHVAIDGFDWVTLATHPPALGVGAVGRARAAFPSDGGGELLRGTLRSFLGLLRSHDGEDGCHYPFWAEQSYVSWATHAVTELGLHRVDVQHALGVESAVSEPQGEVGLEWTVAAVLPVAARLVDDEPPGSVRVVVEGCEAAALGVGEPLVEVRGTAVDLLLRLWNRGGAVEVNGDTATVDWWAALMAREFQHPTPS